MTFLFIVLVLAIIACAVSTYDMHKQDKLDADILARLKRSMPK